MYKPIIHISHQKPVILEDDFDLFGSSGIFEDAAKKCAENFDNMVRKAFGEIKIDVDEAELLKVLAYDRDQYEKGYEDGKTEALTWTSVKDRLPEVGKVVLAYTCYQTFEFVKLTRRERTTFITTRGSDWWDGMDILYWMPLPEPPKDDAE